MYMITQIDKVWIIIIVFIALEKDLIWNMNSSQKRRIA